MIVGFEINKINVERKKSEIKGVVKVKHNLNINSVKERDIVAFKDKKKGIDFEFLFAIDYEPDFGRINLYGSLMYTDNDKKIKEVVDSWSKNKKIPHDVSVEVLNAILSRCNIKALELAEDVDLPSHIPLPRISMEKNKFSDYIG